MKKRLFPIFLSGLMLLLAAAVLTALSCQKVEETTYVTVPVSDLETAYHTQILKRLEMAALGETDTEPFYRILDPTGPAPLPDTAKYGESSDPMEVMRLLENAGDLLDGQSLYFSGDVKLLVGSTIHYYIDDTILAIIWKERINYTAFTFAEVKLLHPSQFRRYLSGGEFGSGQLALTSEMSRSVNAVVGCSGDFYSYRRRGLVIVNGTAKKYTPGLRDTCYVNDEGDLILERDQEFEGLEDVQAYADANNIQFSISFGPILVKDGENICPTGYELGEVKEEFSRAAICQMDRLHYLYIAAGKDGDAYGLMTMRTFAKHVFATGCRQAYAVDGGQTTTIVMNNEVINHVNYGSERRISDIIYFATAIPEEE